MSDRFVMRCRIYFMLEHINFTQAIRASEDSPTPPWSASVLRDLRELIVLDNPRRGEVLLHVPVEPPQAIPRFITAHSARTIKVRRLGPGSLLTHIAGAINGDMCRLLWDELCPGGGGGVQWEQHSLRTQSGKSVPLPRLTALFSVSPSGSTYDYSGTTNISQSMPPLLVNMLTRVGTDFNAVFANYYADGGSSHIGWHSDEEHGMDLSSGILSLSLGATRKFQVIHKAENKRVGRSRQEKNYKIRAGKLVEVNLHEGDILIMEGRDFQRNWLHRITKDSHQKKARIVLTFRRLRTN